MRWMTWRAISAGPCSEALDDFLHKHDNDPRAKTFMDYFKKEGAGKTKMFMRAHR